MDEDIKYDTPQEVADLQKQVGFMIALAYRRGHVDGWNAQLDLRPIISREEIKDMLTPEGA